MSSQAYEFHAHEFLASRDRSEIDAATVEHWCRSLSAGSDILELACGSGYPITRVLHAAGLKIWAVESSPTLIAEFQKRFPTISVQCAKV